jgi:hypothetical protein
MIKAIIRATYSAFISIVLISIILTGWTGFAFISQPTKSGEIINVIQDMFTSQKSVIIDIVELSKLLINDTSKRISSEDNNLLSESESESELLTDQEEKSLFDDLSILEDNGENPLGIFIEPSLPEVSDENSHEITLGPLDSDQREVSINEMEIGMDMN